MQEAAFPGARVVTSWPHRRPGPSDVVGASYLAPRSELSAQNAESVRLLQQARRMSGHTEVRPGAGVPGQPGPSGAAVIGGGGFQGARPSLGVPDPSI